MVSSLEKFPYLSQIKADLVAHRSSHPKKRYLPKSIIQGILKALDQGASQQDLAKYLQLTNGQIARWRRHAHMRQSPISPEVRELTVSPSTDIAPGLRVSYEGGRLVVELSFGQGG